MISAFRKVARGIRTIWRSLRYLENRPLFLGYLPNTSREHLDVKCVHKRNEGRNYPPIALRLGYGSSEDDYVQSGRADVANMRDVLAAHGIEHTMNGPILDFGCGAGRMLFALEEGTDAVLFGADISSEHIAWINEQGPKQITGVVVNRTPPTPFPDQAFSLVYAGSVFTHIDEHLTSWLLEVRRLLSEDGYAYLTMHDSHCVELLLKSGSAWPLAKQVQSTPEFLDLVGGDAREVDCISIGTGADCNIFFATEYITEVLERFFSVVNVQNEAYGYQTAYLLQAKQTVFASPQSSHGA